jgi:hypothetical protein
MSKPVPELITTLNAISAEACRIKQLMLKSPIPSEFAKLALRLLGGKYFRTWLFFKGYWPPDDSAPAMRKRRMGRQPAKGRSRRNR